MYKVYKMFILYFFSKIILFKYSLHFFLYFLNNSVVQLNLSRGKRSLTTNRLLSLSHKLSITSCDFRATWCGLGPHKIEFVSSSLSLLLSTEYFPDFGSDRDFWNFTPITIVNGQMPRNKKARITLAFFHAHF